MRKLLVPVVGLQDHGSQLFNVLAYGAMGNGTHDDTAGIQAALDAANAAGGGTVFFPAGSFLISSTLKLYSGTTPSIVAYSNILIKGSGSSGSGGTLINQATTGLDVFKAINDSANNAQSAGGSFENICVQFTGTPANSGNGIYFAQQSTNSPAFIQWTFTNVRANNFAGTGKAGFNLEGVIVSNFNACHAYKCDTSFYIDGSALGHYGSVSTSLNFTNCYSNGPLTYGYRVVNGTYVNFISCACDLSSTVTGRAYSVEGSNSVAFYSCGFECDGSHTLAAGFYIGADASSVGSLGTTMIGCYGYQSKSTKEIYLTGSSKGTVITGYQSNSSVSGSTALVMDAGTTVFETQNNFDAGVATVRTIATGAIDIIMGDSDGYGAISGFLSLAMNAANISTDTTTGTKIGTAATQKLGFFNATPVVQQTATTDLGTALSALGFRVAGTAYPITTSGAVAFTGAHTSNSFTPNTNTPTVTANAGSVAAPTYEVSKFVNSSAATMTITMITTGAVNGQQAYVMVYDFSAVAETITWVNTENSTVSVPTTSNGSTTLPKIVTFMYNSATSKWRCIASV